jgi:hypothetical protein
MTASMLPTLVGALASFQCRALYVMELPKLKDCGDDILRAAKIKILAPQKLAKDCLTDVGFPPFLTKHKAMLVRFKRTLDSCLLLDSDSPEKAWKVARRGVPGMVVVDHYSVAELLSTNDPSFASLSSKKSASSLSPKLDSALPLSSAKKPTWSLSTNPVLSNCRVTITKNSAQLHKTMESKAKENSLENMDMSTATRLLAAHKEKPKSERLDSTKVVEIINQEFKSTLNHTTVRRYVKRGHIGCGRLQKGRRGRPLAERTTW